MRTILLAVSLSVAPACAQIDSPPIGGVLHGMEPDRTEIDSRETPIVRAVRRAQDAVVSIYLTRGDESLERGVDGSGSGVILDADGLVITNWHVIAAAAGRRIYALLKDGHSFRADVLSSSPEHDLALLQLRDAGRLAPIQTGNSSSLMIGETVIAIGNPQGLANSVTAGVLSSVDRSITVRTPDGRVRKYSGLLQTDAAINQGNSGGALLDINGRLIGINNAMAVGVENIGYAIPVDTVRRVFEEVLVSSENLASVWFGLRVRDDAGKAVIASIDPNGPAARAGFRPGDVIVEAGGRTVKNALDYARATLRAESGRTFDFTVQRSGDDGIALAVQPMAKVEWYLLQLTGLEVDQVRVADDRKLLETASRELYAGTRRSRIPLLPAVLRVRRVVADSPGAELGLQRGDVIIAASLPRMFGGFSYTPLRSVEEFAAAARDWAGRQLMLLLLRDGEALEGALAVRR